MTLLTFANSLVGQVTFMVMGMASHFLKKKLANEDKATFMEYYGGFWGYTLANLGVAFACLTALVQSGMASALTLFLAGYTCDSILQKSVGDLSHVLPVPKQDN